MDITITPGLLCGDVEAVPSKSMAHRYLICAAFADAITNIYCPAINQDIEATVVCLQALGSEISYDNVRFTVKPARQIPKSAVLDCGESGSTLRFLLPIVGALGVNATFILKGHLADRPMEDLCLEMTRMGCQIHKTDHHTLVCSGQLQAGNYHITGSVSSQFSSGLLFAMALIPGNCHLNITDTLQSRPYVHMTRQALEYFSIDTNDLTISADSKFRTPKELFVEGDWSNAAFYFAANALGSSVNIRGLDPHSMQGDQNITRFLSILDNYSVIDGADTPDLIPVLSVIAAAKQGAVFMNIEKLRYKESDRVAAIISMLDAFGVSASATINELTVKPGRLNGCTVDPCGDHRIAMSAAIAATIANGPVTILNAECVSKSYPHFWQDFRKLGGKYEQHIR